MTSGVRFRLVRRMSSLSDIVINELVLNTN